MRGGAQGPARLRPYSLDLHQSVALSCRFILPSLAPALSIALFDLETASISLGWQPFNFLVDAIQVGPIGLQLVDVGTLA